MTIPYAPVIAATGVFLVGIAALIWALRQRGPRGPRDAAGLANRALLVVNIGLVIVVLYFLGTRGLGLPASNFEYKDLIAIILTALAVILAAVTIFVAGLAIWGYTTIRESAERAAVATAEEAAKLVAADVARATASREAPEAVRLYLAAAGSEAPNAADVDGLAASLKEGNADDSAGDGAKPERNHRRKDEENPRRHGGDNR
jgi:hypothetical protein